MRSARIAVVADDLTGAADTGIGFVRAGFGVALYTDPPTAPITVGSGVDVLTIDTDTRAGSASVACEITARTVGTLVSHGVEVCYLKVDSMLRGHPAESTDAALRASGPGATAIVAPAFPGTGRTTVDGRQRVRGEPLPIAPLPELFAVGGREVAQLDLAAVRAVELPELIARHRRAGATVIVCDAVEDADLAAIARAGGSEPGVVWVGSGGLAAALAPTLPAPNHARRRRIRVAGPVLVTVGTMAPIAATQVTSLVAAGVELVQVSPDSPGSPDSPADRIGALLAAGLSVVATLDGPPGGAGGDQRLAAAFADRLVRYLDLAGALVATGGDTARALLRAAGIARLDLVDEIEPGVVLTVAADGDLPVVTKAGSFGDAATLTTAVRRLTNPKEPQPCQPS